MSFKYSNMSVPENSIGRGSERRRLNNLIVAMLDLSFKDLSRSVSCNKDRIEIKKSAIDWFENESIDPFTFIWCCEVLKIDSKKFLEQCRKRYN